MPQIFPYRLSLIPMKKIQMYVLVDICWKIVPEIDMQYDPDQERRPLLSNWACKRSANFVTFQKPGTEIFLHSDLP